MTKTITFVCMTIWRFIFLFLSLAFSIQLKAQDTLQSKQSQSDGIIARMIYIDGEKMPCFQLPVVTVYPKKEFKNKKEELAYNKMVQDVRKTLPLAKLVHRALIETYEYIETLPTEKERIDHLKRMEKELFKEYKPVLKKLNYRQGKLLIRLIDRECNQSSYHLVKAFLGSFRAGFWQAFGSLFGVSLKAEWEPEGKDAELEIICDLIEHGFI